MPASIVSQAYSGTSGCPVRALQRLHRPFHVLTAGFLTTSLTRNPLRSGPRRIHTCRFVIPFVSPRAPPQPERRLISAKATNFRALTISRYLSPNRFRRHPIHKYPPPPVASQTVQLNPMLRRILQEVEKSDTLERPFHTFVVEAVNRIKQVCYFYP